MVVGYLYTVVFVERSLSSVAAHLVVGCTIAPIEHSMSRGDGESAVVVGGIDTIGRMSMGNRSIRSVATQMHCSSIRLAM